MTTYPPVARMSRRRLLLGAVAMTGAVGADRLGMPFISRGLANTPIRIGVILATTGPMSAEAEAIKHGAEEALILQGRKAMGQPVELVFMDEPDEAGAVANMKKLITDHKVAAIAGGTAAGPALAMSKAAAEAKIPYIVHTAMYDEITGKDCNAWTFRVPAPFDVQYHAIAPYLTGYGKKWFLMSEDSMSGKEMLVHAREALKAAGAQEVGVEVVKVGSHALAGPIDKIKAAKPDVVVGCLMGEDVTDFLKQWKAAGMTGKIPFAQPSVNDADLYKAGADAMTGIFTKTWHFADPKLSAEDKDFVAAYAKQFNGEMPSSDAWQTFMAIRTIAESIDKAASTEPAKVLTALRAFERKSGPITLAYRNSDHQMMHQIPILETKSQISHKLNWWDVEAHYPEKPSELDKLYGDAKQNSCKMPAA